jgi:hypothetical protein
MRRSLSLLLFVSLLVYPLSVTQEQEVWHEGLVPWRAKGWLRRRCRRARASIAKGAEICYTMLNSNGKEDLSIDP